MIASAKTLAMVAMIGAAGVVCPLCLSGSAATVTTQSVSTVAQAADTAVARLHISGMTCGSCPVTARIALTRVPGVYTAKVTLPDSLGVVHYNPSRVSSKEIATQLTKMTGYAAVVLSDTTKAVTGKRGG